MMFVVLAYVHVACGVLAATLYILQCSQVQHVCC